MIRSEPRRAAEPWGGASEVAAHGGATLRGRVVRREDLGRERVEAMYRLMGAHFEGVGRDGFERDLDEKGWVILLEQGAGEGARLCGFSTLDLYTVRFRGETVHVVYSGDTLVEASARGSSLLPRTWIRAVLSLRRQHLGGGAPFVWLLLTSGFRTYRFLPVFFRRYHPRPGADEPPRLGELRDFLARLRFRDAYDAAAGVVRFAEPQVLRPDLRTLPASRLADPHVAFFAARNPGHERGDELVCLTELDPLDLTPAGRRMVGRP